MRKYQSNGACRSSRSELLLVVAALAVLCHGAASAQQFQPPPVTRVNTNSSPNLVGSGARALGMGGAFIAVADDATSASWNPGGLTQLELPEFSAVYAWKWFREDFNNTRSIRARDDFLVDVEELNYFSVVYPIPRTLGGRNLVVSLNYQQQYNFDVERKYRASLARAASSHSRQPPLELWSTDTIFQRGNVRVKGRGSVSSITPAFGFELTDRISCGIAVNIWNDSVFGNNEWTMFTRETPSLVANRFIDLHMGGQLLQRIGVLYNHHERIDKLEEYKDFRGTNYTFGLLVKPTPRLSVGVVYHTALAARVDYSMVERNITFGAAHVRQNGVSTGVQPYVWNPRFRYVNKTLRIEYPSALGVGVAYRFPDDKLTLSLDVTRRDWDSYAMVDPWRGRFSPVNGLPMSRTSFKPAYTVRFGGEYVFFDPRKPARNLMPILRAGVFYDPEPASGRKDRLWGISQGGGDLDDYYGVALGAGVLIHNRVNIDVAYQYRWGNNVRRDMLAGNAPVLERGFSTDVSQHLFYLSTVVYLK